MIQNKGGETLCTVCSKQYTKYTCPQCHIRYCSLTCYKKHSSVCSERFQVKQLQEILQDKDVKRVSPQVKQQTLQMLNDFHKRQEDIQFDEDVFEELSDDQLQQLVYRLSMNDNIDDIVLPNQLKRDFEKALTDGRMASWIALYNPWWIDGGDGSSSDDFDIDQITCNLPALSKIAPKCSPVIKWFVVELIYGYAYLMRMFNGEVHAEDTEMIIDFISLLVNLCPNALHTPPPDQKKNNSSNTQPVLHSYENVNHVMRTMIEYSQRPQLFHSIEFSIGIMQDTCIIFGQKSLATRACHEMQQLFHKAITLHQQKKKELSDLKRLKLLERKLYFYLVWCNDQVEQVFPELSKQINEQYEEHKELMNQRKQSEPITKINTSEMKYN